MKKKKVLSMMLVGTMALGMLAGCGGKEESAEAGGEESLEKAGYDIDAMEVEDTTVKLYHRINTEGGDAESEFFIRNIK